MSYTIIVHLNISFSNTEPFPMVENWALDQISTVRFFVVCLLFVRAVRKIRTIAQSISKATGFFFVHHARARTHTHRHKHTLTHTHLLRGNMEGALPFEQSAYQLRAVYSACSASPEFCRQLANV